MPSRLLLGPLVLLAAGLSLQAADNPSATARGDRLRDAYFRRQTEQTADAALAGIRTREDWERQRPELRNFRHRRAWLQDAGSKQALCIERAHPERPEQHLLAVFNPGESPFPWRESWQGTNVLLWSESQRYGGGRMDDARLLYPREFAVLAPAKESRR